MKTAKAWLYPALLAATALVLYAFLNYKAGVSVIQGNLAVHEFGRALVWSAAYALFALSFLLAVLVFDGWGLAILLVMASGSFLTNRIYNVIVDQRLEPESLRWLLDQSGALGNAWGEFTGTFLTGAAAVAAVVWLFLLWRRLILRVSPTLSTARSRKVWRFGAVAAFGVIHIGCFLVRPSLLPAETNIPFYTLGNYFTPEPDPLPVAWDPSRSTGIEKIVLIVDESVRSDYFHRLVGDTLRNIPCLDFGEAASTVNASAGSNALLRWGLDESRLNSKDYDPRCSPYIWSFARRAGYRTVLMDGQNEGRPQNFLGQKEARLIDEQLPLKSNLEADAMIAGALRQHLGAPGKEFIYIVKRGVHFPYEHSCPPDWLPDHPTRTQKYEAALRFNTGRFFSRLGDGIDYRRVFMIYTSDHGQVFVEGRPTHANPHPTWEEYSVPLCVVTASKEIAARLSGRINAVRDHASHEQIFPTLLYAMGFDLTGISLHYAPPLFERAERYNVLLYPFIPTVGQHPVGIAFSSFDHFPYRVESRATQATADTSAVKVRLARINSEKSSRPPT